MILFTRATAWNFSVLVHHCVTGRPRGPAPPILVRISNGTRTLISTTADGVILTHVSCAPRKSEASVVLPATALDEVAGHVEEPVWLERESAHRGVIRWHEQTTTRRVSVELLAPVPPHESPNPPSFTDTSPQLLIALSECGRSAARQSGAYDLAKIQVQGDAGRVVGSDGTCAILYGGLSFPFLDRFLVPAVSVFGVQPLARSAKLRVGLSPTHLVIGAGPWSVALPTDTRTRYPDLAAAIPQHSRTIVRIARADAAVLQRCLPDFPGHDHELQPVTIDTMGVVCVRGRSASGLTSEVTLHRSPVEGPGFRIAVDRRMLARALTLGCCTLKRTPDGPVVLEGEKICLLVAPSVTALIVPPTATTGPLIKKLKTNDRARPGIAAEELLVITEELRVTLTNAATLSARLVSALRQSK